MVLCGQKLPTPTAVRVDEVDLSAYDQLLDGQSAEMGLAPEGVSHE